MERQEKTYGYEKWAQRHVEEVYICDSRPKWSEEYDYGDPYASKYGYENYDEEWNQQFFNLISSTYMP